MEQTTNQPKPNPEVDRQFSLLWAQYAASRTRDDLISICDFIKTTDYDQVQALYARYPKLFAVIHRMRSRWQIA